MPKRILQWLMIAMLLIAARAHALSAEEAKGIASGESDARVAALQKAVENADERTVRFLQALSDDAVKLVGNVPVIMVDGKGVDPVTQAEVAVPDTAEDVMNNNRMRGELDNALAAVKLLSPDVAVRRAAINTLNGQVDAGQLPLLEKALATEAVPDLKEKLQQLRAAALLGQRRPRQAPRSRYTAGRQRTGSHQDFAGRAPAGRNRWLCESCLAKKPGCRGSPSCMG